MFSLALTSYSNDIYVFINCIYPRTLGNDHTLPQRTTGYYLQTFTSYRKARAVRRMQTNTCTKALGALSCNSKLPPTPKLIQPCPKASNCLPPLSKPCPKAPINTKTCHSLTQGPQSSQWPPDSTQALSQNSRWPSITPGHGRLPPAFGTPQARPGSAGSSHSPQPCPHAPSPPRPSGQSVNGSAQANGKRTPCCPQRSRAGGERPPVPRCCHRSATAQYCVCPGHASGHSRLPCLLLPSGGRPAVLQPVEWRMRTAAHGCPCCLLWLSIQCRQQTRASAV